MVIELGSRTPASKIKYKLPPPIQSGIRSNAGTDAQGFGYFTNFNSEDGLILDMVYSSMMDSRGNLWFGTGGGGVSRYDGKSFIHFTIATGLANNVVNCMIEDRKGNLWFGTEVGLSCYDGISFTNYTTAQGLINNLVNCIHEDKEGILWIGTITGVSRFDGKSFERLTGFNWLPLQTVWCIEEDLSGNLWFGTAGGGAYRYDRKTFTLFNRLTGLVNDNVRCITPDSKGNLWFGTVGGGVSRFDGKSFYQFTTDNGLSSNYIRCITLDPDGNLWIGTGGGGVNVYEKDRFIHLTMVQGLANNTVRCITTGKSGIMWIGTFGGGVSCYHGKHSLTFSTEQGLPNGIVWSIHEDRLGNIWLATENGVSRYDGLKFLNLTTNDGLTNNSVRCVTEDSRGNLWFGTWGGGAILYDGKSFTHFTVSQGLAGNSIWWISETKEGDMWFGTTKGASRFDGKTFTNYTREQGLGNDQVYCIIGDRKGNFWLGTGGGGVSRFDGKSFTNFTTDQGLPSNVINRIAEDASGNLWFGTNSGICRYDGNTFVTYTTRNGLPDNVVSQIVFNREGKIITGTNRGVCELISFVPKAGCKNKNLEIPIQTDLKNPDLDCFALNLDLYHSPDGYTVKSVNFGQSAILNDSKGILWIGTSSDKSGLVRFDPAEITSAFEPALVQIQGVRINNENVSWYDLFRDKQKPNDSLYSRAALIEEGSFYGNSILTDEEKAAKHQRFSDLRFTGITKFYPLPQNLVIPHRHNQISFDFAAIEPSLPNLTRYQYYLQGYDGNWSPVTNKTSATFGKISGGNYTFKVKAQSPFGKWSDPVSYSFKVLSPWWRTWWAFLIFSILIIASVALIVKMNSRRLIKKNEGLQKIINEKEKIQAELVISKDKAEESDRLKSAFLANMSHEIRTPMNGILGFTEMLEEADLTGEEQQKYIHLIKKSGDRLLNIITNIVTFSKLESGAEGITVTKTNVNGKLDYILSFFISQAQQKGLQLLCIARLEEQESEVTCDPEKILTILTNLVKNAINFTPAGSIEFGCRKKERFLEFFVRDTGIGIPKNQKDLIFNRFRKGREVITKTHEGAGLGLSIAKGYVEIMGGKIWFESEAGKGSCFYFTVPGD